MAWPHSGHRGAPVLVVGILGILPSFAQHTLLAHTLSLSVPRRLESEALVAGPIAQLGVEVESRGRQSAHCRTGGTERKGGRGCLLFGGRHREPERET